MSAIELRAVCKSYGSTPVLKGLDLTIPDASTTAILGPSGSGKSTVLRLIAGFDHTDSGVVRIGENTMDDGRTNIRPQHRGVGYVPQDAALFPHLTVAANVAFGLRRQHRHTVGQLLSLVGLDGYGKRYPHQLSGGQQQRVALARALAIKPHVVLLDEPFGSLDASLRNSVRAEVIAILAQTKTTTVLVTHDQDEALSVADHIAMLDNGTIVAHGTPHELYEHPPTPTIARTLGSANILSGHISNGRVSYPFGDFPCSDRENSSATECQVLLRPEQLCLDAHSEDTRRLAGTITAVRYQGHDTVFDLTSDIGPLIARTHDDREFSVGQHVYLSVGDTTPHTWS